MNLKFHLLYGNFIVLSPFSLPLTEKEEEEIGERAVPKVTLINKLYKITFNLKSININFLLRFIFIYQKSLFQTGFWVQNHLLNVELWIHKGYLVVKKLVWNVRIKSFWTKNILSIFQKGSLYYFFIFTSRFYYLVEKRH